tara:strand:- start:722 stop:922 length:201 start_codon:yes stop_codon:yes gene_type:complete
MENEQENADLVETHYHKPQEWKQTYNNELNSLRQEFERVKEYNLDLKLQVIEAKEKLYKILEILNK